MRLFDELPGQLRRLMGNEMRYTISVEHLANKKGRAVGKTEALLRMLRRRFHAVPSELKARVRTAHDAQLDEWFDRILDAKTLTDVFADIGY